MKLFSKKRKCIVCGKEGKKLCSDCQVIQDRRADITDVDLLKEYQCPVCDSVPLVLRKGMYDEYYAMVKELEELREARIRRFEIPDSWIKEDFVEFEDDEDL